MADTTKKTVTYEIQGDSTKLIRTIEGAMRQIDMLETKLSRVATKKDVSPVSEGSTRDALDRIASVTRAINNLEKTQTTLESVDLSLLSEPQLQLIKVASDEIKNLAKDMGNLRDAGKVSQEQLDKVESTTRKVNQAIKDAGITTINFEAVATKAARRTAQEAKQSAQEYQTALRAIKNGITSTIGVLRTLITAGFGLMSEAADFGETMNKFNVVAGKSSQVLGDFADRLADAYGLDPKDLYEGVASFKSVANSIKLADKPAEKFTKNLTSLSLDLASLYNTSVEHAMESLVSGLHGQERAMKQYNVYLYEANIQQKAYDIGLRKSTASMNEAEKVCLRYMVAMDQTKDAQGDLQRTITSTANQIKILQAQFAQFKRALGQVFTVIGMTVVPVLNTLLNALVKVFTLMASKMGYEIENFASAFDASGDSASGAAEDITKYGKAAAGLSGLDEINLVSNSRELDTIDTTITKAMEKYKDLSEGLQGTFSDLADKISQTIQDSLAYTVLEALADALVLIGKGMQFITDNWESFEPVIRMLINLTTVFLVLAVVNTVKGWGVALMNFVSGPMTRLTTALGKLPQLFRRNSKVLDSQLTPAISGTTIALSALTLTAGYFIGNAFINAFEGNARKMVGIITTIVAALTAATVAVMAYRGALTLGVAVPIITAAIGAGAAGVKALIPSVPQMATGGVVNKPTMAMIGEGRYNEAVVPLGNSPQFTAMKGEIAEEVARKLAQTPYSPYGSTSRGSQANVILQVNGRELARALLPDLGITRPQTGVKLV